MLTRGYFHANFAHIKIGKYFPFGLNILHIVSLKPLYLHISHETFISSYFIEDRVVEVVLFRQLRVRKIVEVAKHTEREGHFKSRV